MQHVSRSSYCVAWRNLVFVLRAGWWVSRVACLGPKGFLFAVYFERWAQFWGDPPRKFNDPHRVVLRLRFLPWNRVVNPKPLSVHGTDTNTDMPSNPLIHLGKKRVHRPHQARRQLQEYCILATVKVVVACHQGSRSRIGVSRALAARVGSKYSRINTIFPLAARRNTTYS